LKIENRKGRNKTTQKMENQQNEEEVLIFTPGLIEEVFKLVEGNLCCCFK
jgi:hypothetical protein